MTDQSNHMAALEARITRLESATRRLRVFATAAVVCSAAATAAAVTVATPVAGAHQASSGFQVLDSMRLRQLIVVDSNGRERARVGAPLPEPMLLGRRVPRGGLVSGFLISDAEGNERGGYVTSDRHPNALLTLDDMATQKVLLLAEPQGSTTFGIFHAANALWMGANDSTPYVRLEKNRAVVARLPADTVR